MDGWIGALPGLLIVIAWLFVPGGVLLWILGARGILLAAGGPAVGVLFLGVLAIAFGRLGVAWSPFSVAIAAAVLIAAFWGGRSLLRRNGSSSRAATEQHDPRRSRVVAIVWAAAGLLIGAQLIVALGRPDAVSQTFDNGFHLNAVRFILDSDNGSSFSITGVLGTQSFYPAAWHDLVSLVAAVPGVAVPVAATVTNIAVAAIVWPGAVLLLTRVLLPRSTAALVISALFCAVLPWFPLLMLTFGVLFPYFLAAVFLPLALGLAFSVLGRSDGLVDPLPTRWFTLIAVLGAMVLAQPAVAFAAVAFVIPAFLSSVLCFVRGTAAVWKRVVFGAAALALVGVFAVLWVVIGRMGSNAPWGASAGLKLGLLEALLFFRNGQTPSFLIAFAVLIGLVTILWRRKRLWLAGTWLIGAGLFIVAEVVNSAAVRNALLGLFYKDPPRLAALFAIVSLPVAIVGATWIWNSVRYRVVARSTDRGNTPQRSVVFGGIAVLLILILAGQGVAMTAAVSAASATYSFDNPAPILSTDELELIERMPETTDPDGVIAGNPWTGTNLAYALADRVVLNPHFNYSQDPDHVLINSRLVEAASDPAVCDAVTRLRLGYVLDFGDYVRDAAGVLNVDASAGFAGLDSIASAPGFIEIDRQGEAVLYRITACG